MNTQKTIFAPATPLGGAIAVIRISGDKTRAVLSAVFTGKTDTPSHLAYGKIVNSAGETLDEAMAVFFKAPRSYTGEDMAELHIHASRAVFESVAELLSEYGLVPAEAGEFSRRAFLNGKMQLSQAEAVMDLISSAAQRSARSAVLQLEGVLSERIAHIENEITDALSEIDAAIDYPDEMEDSETDIRELTVRAERECAELITSGMRAHKLRDGFTVAIVGRPNTGKSSLLNALISENRAIVTDIAGTTRDVIEADAVFCGLPVHLFDTAGLHDTDDPVEQIGIQRAKSAMENADLLYITVDSSKPLTDADRELIKSTEHKSRIIVLCKTDICKTDICEGNFEELSGMSMIRVSAVTGEGVEELKRMTAQRICPDDESGIITNMRHINALTDAKSALADALFAGELDCMATDLQNALHALGSITGNSVDENVIDRIFERFCVGK